MSLTLVMALVLGGCGKPGTIDVDTTGEDTQDVSDPDVAGGGDSGIAGDVTEDTGDGIAACELDGGALLVAEEGDFLSRGEVLDGARERCTQVIHAGAGAAGSTLTLTLEGWSGAGAVQLAVMDLLGEPMAAWETIAVGEGVSFAPAISGEFFVRLAPVDPDEDETDYALSLACEAGCELAYTRYPLVMMHGMGGTDTFGEGLLDYWYQLAEPMAEAGYHAEMPGVTSWDPIEDRAPMWQDVLDALEAEGIGRRFNLIGHSQGGLDARYLTSVLEPAAGHDRVVSVTTVASPHHGTAVADLFAGIIDEDGFFAGVIDVLVESLSGLIGLSGDDLMAQVADLSTVQMDAFNAEVLDRSGVSYYSWAGHSCGWVDFSCQADWDGELVDAALVTSYLVVSLAEGDNDGLVPIDSAKWGEFLGEIPADHMDQVGQIADNNNEPFDHIGFFLDEAARLAEAGF